MRRGRRVWPLLADASYYDAGWEGGDGAWEEEGNVGLVAAAEEDTGGGNIPDFRFAARHFPLLGRRDCDVARELVEDRAARRLDDCACVRPFVERAAAGRPRGRTVNAVIGSDDAKSGADVMTDVPRCLCRWDGGQHRHVGLCEMHVAAGRSGGKVEVGRDGNGGHFAGRHWKWVGDAVPRQCLTRCSRGKGLDRDSPVLRIRMETTRAGLLWQAAVVRPGSVMSTNVSVSKAAEDVSISKRIIACAKCWGSLPGIGSKGIDL